MTEQTVEHAPEAGAPEAAPQPDTAPASDTAAPAGDSAKELMRLGLTKMAEKEDATDFIEELRDQRAFKAGDPAADNNYRREARHARYQSLIEQARKDTADALAQDWQSQSEAADAKIEDARLRAKAELRIEQYERQNPGWMDYVKQTIETYGDVTEDVAKAIYTSPRGAEIIDHMCQNPEAIDVLNQLPPRELDRFVARMEGLLDGGQAAPTPLPKPKRVSSAPKPVPTITGRGTAPATKDLHELAKSEDATAFIEESRRRNRAKAR